MKWAIGPGRVTTKGENAGSRTRSGVDEAVRPTFHKVALIAVSSCLRERPFQLHRDL